MANPIFKFSLLHSSGSQSISEPIGWLDAKLKLERHEDYHSLIEYFTGSFVFYGSNGVDDGGLDFIRHIEQTFGPDATIEILIEISVDGGVNYEDLFSGQLDITSINEDNRNQAELAIIRDDFWSKFIARKETPVDLQATKDLDSATIIPVDRARIHLTPQELTKIYDAYSGENFLTKNFSGGGPGNDPYHTLDWDVEILDEIPETFTYPLSSSAEIPFEKFSMENDGDYLFDSRITMHQSSDGLGSTIPYIKIWFQINGNDPIEFSKADRLVVDSGFVNDGTTPYSFNSDVTDYTFSETFTLKARDSIRIYAEMFETSSHISNFDIYSVNGDPKIRDSDSFQGYWNPSLGTFPSTSASGGTILSGMVWLIQSAGTIHGINVEKDWVIRAYINSPGQSTANWYTNSIGFTQGLFAYGESRLKVVGKTVYVGTTAEGFLIHDAGAAILKSYGLGEENPFYSKNLGSPLTTARQYSDYGCDWGYILLGGLQARSYTLEQKPKSISFEDWWKGANPILNLGLGYGEIIGTGDPGFTPFFLVPLNLWGSIDTSPNYTWTGGTNPYNTASGPTIGATSSDFFGPTGVLFEVGRTYKYEFGFTYAPFASLACEVHVVVTNVAFTVLTEKVVNMPNGGGSAGDTFEFVAPSGAARLGVVVKYPSNLGGVGTYVLTIEYFNDLTESILPSPASQKIIEVEKKSEFYDDGDTSIDFDYVIDIARKYDDKVIFNKIDIGYTQWKSEDISGIDDPQTKHTYATRLQKIGQGISLMSDFIAASLALEVTRRQSIVKSKDYKYDDNTFIIAINPDDTSPDTYLPELNENYDSVSNLSNHQTRYNKRLTPARNLLRWINYLNISLQSYLTSFYKFVSGEGNYDMISEMKPNSCGDSFSGNSLSEKQDIPVTDTFLHDPRLYTITIPMQWEQYKIIVANRKKAIGISQTDKNHKKFYIQDLEYQPCYSRAIIQAWPKEYFEITQTDFEPPILTCEPAISECDEETVRVTDDDEFRVTSDGDCRITV